MKQIVRATLGALALTLGAAAQADGTSPLWEIKGKSNTVFLLGSVHVLRESDYPLPAVILDAYREAEALYMEIDLDNLDAGEALQFTLERGSLPPDRSLRDILGVEAFATADMRATAIGLDLGMFARFEPWVAALAVVQAQVASLGLLPEHGIEQYVLNLATKDGKEVLGLETMADQLGVLDSLELDRQGKFLMMSLEEAEGAREQLDGMIAAWRKGDSASLAATLSQEFGEFPDLYAPLIVTRNRNWATQIADLLDDDRDYLVVVGALHLVGNDSVIELLNTRGIRATQR